MLVGVSPSCVGKRMAQQLRGNTESTVRPLGALTHRGRGEIVPSLAHKDHTLKAGPCSEGWRRDLPGFLPASVTLQPKTTLQPEHSNVSARPRKGAASGQGQHEQQEKENPPITARCSKPPIRPHNV